MGVTMCETATTKPIPRVIVVGMASCFGCQLQITNDEKHLLDVLGQVDLRYWQLTSSDPMPENFDIAIIEGAATTEEALETLRAIRAQAKHVISIGACAATAGVCGMAAKDFGSRVAQVYNDQVPAICKNMVEPRAISQVIEVDYQVPCCPIDPSEFLEVLSRALYGSNRILGTQTMCGDCKRNQNGCFFADGTLCLGLVTRAGCSSRCVNLGRPCNGCRGLSPDANLESAREAVARYGVSVEDFDSALEMFNQTNPVLLGKE